MSIVGDYAAIKRRCNEISRHMMLCMKCNSIECVHTNPPSPSIDNEQLEMDVDRRDDADRF
jgi:hypothetical protein